MVEELQKRLSDRHIVVDLSPEAINYIVEEGFDPIYGARPLRRFIQQHVETLIARSLISGNILDGAKIAIDSDGKKLQLNWKNQTLDGLVLLFSTHLIGQIATRSLQGYDDRSARVASSNSVLIGVLADLTTVIEPYSTKSVQVEYAHRQDHGK